jgi:hypothetical protein
MSLSIAAESPCLHRSTNTASSILIFATSVTPFSIN